MNKNAKRTWLIHLDQLGNVVWNKRTYSLDIDEDLKSSEVTCRTDTDFILTGNADVAI
jgi:hypothetical protein